MAPDRPMPPEETADGTECDYRTQCDSNDDVHAQLRRRRDASRRLPPLSYGGGDPWTCRCYGSAER